jgi:hypothetical protein
MNEESIARVHVWCDPPSTELPLRTDEMRFAVGTPRGFSSNSWKVWVKGNDVYVACRDTLKEFKVSLHASGIWRLGLTEQAVRARPDLIKPGTDRVMKKWSPPLDEAVTKAFYVVTTPWSLHVEPKDRSSWPKSVLFIEPEVKGAEFISICVTVARTREPLAIANGVRAVVLGVLPLPDDRSVQVLAMYEPAEPIAELISQGLSRVSDEVKEALSDGHHIALFGERSDNVPWITMISVRRILQFAAEMTGADG